MGRRPRAAAQAAAASLRTPTAQIDEGNEHSEEEEAMEVDVEAATSDVESARDETPQPQNSALQSERSTPAPVQQSPPRKRRLGRPPKNKPPEWDAGDNNADDGGSDAGTPKKRRGRPPAAGGGRWGKKGGGPAQVTQVAVDKEGTMMDVVDDELILPEDPEGETKVDKNGHLLGGRDYRCRTFTLLGKGDKLYMLSTEPARCIGFRDSYLFFQKHRFLFKLIIDDNLKRDMIERDLIPHSYKGRSIGVVTARSVFREFGARIIIGGKRITDDYQVEVARTEGAVEGELADPQDQLPKAGEPYNKNQYVAWHGASSVYHTGVPSVPMPSGKVVDPKKRKVVVTDVNWMLEHALEASRFNATLAAARRHNHSGVYDPHTNTMQYPKNTQPTHARWELIEPSSDPESATNGDIDTLTNGYSALTTNGNDEDEAIAEDRERSTMFTSVNPLHARNFAIVDTQFVSPDTPYYGPISMSDPNDEYDFNSKGLCEVSEEVYSCLPPACLEAFMEAREKERAWRVGWGTESQDGARAKLRVGFQAV